MSKAFTKEDDAASVEPALPRRDRDAAPVLTPDGAQRMRGELDDLINVRRPLLSKSQPPTTATQHELDQVERRIRELQQTLLTATVVAPPPADDAIHFGATVTVRDSFGDEEQYRIVGPDEIDLARNWISSASPMARALINRRAGERVSFESPAGEQVLDILAVTYE